MQLQSYSARLGLAWVMVMVLGEFLKWLSRVLRGSTLCNVTSYFLEDEHLLCGKMLLPFGHTILDFPFVLSDHINKITSNGILISKQVAKFCNWALILCLNELQFYLLHIMLHIIV